MSKPMDMTLAGIRAQYQPDADNVYALFRLERVDGPATPSASLLSVQRMNKAAYVPT